LVFEDIYVTASFRYFAHHTQGFCIMQERMFL